MGRILGQLVHRRLERVSVVNVFGQLFLSLLSSTFIRLAILHQSSLAPSRPG